MWIVILLAIIGVAYVLHSVDKSGMLTLLFMVLAMIIAGIFRILNVINTSL
jgi:uncharacterized protein (UPF0333 family)